MAIRKQNEMASQEKLYQSICSVYVTIMVVVHLLSFSKHGYINIADIKYTVFLWSTLLLVVVVGLLHVEWFIVSDTHGITVWKTGRRVGLTRWKLFALLYAGMTVLSAICSPYTGTWFGNGRKDGALTIILYVSMTMVLSRYWKAKRWMIDLLAGVVLVICAIGFLQFMGYNPFHLYPRTYTYYDAGIYYAGQYWSTLGNTNLAISVLCVCFGVLFFAITLEDGEIPWYWGITLLVLTCAIVELQVLSGYVAICLGVLLCFPVVVSNGVQLKGYIFSGVVTLAGVALACSLSFSAKGVQVRLGKTGIVCCIGALILGVVWQKMPSRLPAMWEKRFPIVGVSVCTILFAGTIAVLYSYDGFNSGIFYEIHQILHGNGQDQFGTGRLFIWKQVLEKIPEYPWLGGGPDTLGQRNLQEFSRYSTELHTTITGSIDAAHNEFLNIFVNQGGLSLLNYLILLGTCIQLWWKRRESKVSSIAGGTMVLYLLVALFGISTTTNTPYLWFSISLLCCQCGDASTDGKLQTINGQNS